MAVLCLLTNTSWPWPTPARAASATVWEKPPLGRLCGQEQARKGGSRRSARAGDREEGPPPSFTQVRWTTKADVDEIVGITGGTLGRLLRFCLPSPTRSITELLYYPFRSIQSRSTSLAKAAKPTSSLIEKLLLLPVLGMMNPWKCFQQIYSFQLAYVLLFLLFFLYYLTSFK